jgi:phosphoribosyl 1,2-cyclic phosphodiesterase
MSLSLSILASGSAGNCGLVRAPGGVMLIDCGIGPRVAAMRMKHLGVSAAEISGICLTHLDSDHFSTNWVKFIVRQQIAVHCHQSRVRELVDGVGDEDFARLVTPFNGSAFSTLPGVWLKPIKLSHDEHGSHGFVIAFGDSRIGYATDLGRVHQELIGSFAGAQVVAIESNYDADMQQASARPWFLKQRIMGGRGHLSNREALAAVREMLDRAEREGKRLPSHIVLLHRSQECNCPKLLWETFCADSRIPPRLVLAEQHSATPWMKTAAAGSVVGAQLELQWS